MSQKSRSVSTEGKMMSELPYKTLKDISDRLDLLKDGKTSYWRELATLMDYSHITVEKFGMQASKPTGSPGYSLLLDMSNKGVSYDELVSYLKRLELYDALVQIGYKEDVRITKQPVATPVMIGQKLRLECRAAGVPRPQYMWFQGQKPLGNQKSSVLEIDKVTTDHAGIYTCRVNNTANIVFSQWVEVQVQNPTNKGPVAEVPNDDSPVITEHPKPSMLEVGQKLYLNCQAYASGKLDYQWFLNGKELIYGTSDDLVINQVQMSDQGVYVCCVKSCNGASVLTKGAEVIIVPPGGLPVVPQQPTLNHPAHEHSFPPIITTMNCETPNIDPNVPTTYPDHHQSAAAAGGYTPVQSKPPYRLPDEPTFPQLMRQQQQQQQHPPSSQTVHSPPEEPHGMMPPYGSSIQMPDINMPPTTPPYGDSSPSFSIVNTGPRNPPPTTPGPNSPLHTKKEDLIIDDGPGGQDYLIDKPCADKVALLIGNKNYHVKSLRLNTPENDTQDLSGILRSADFKVVSLVNLTKKEMDDAINYFTQLLGPNVYAVFFFAGHGFELNNMNYMMAVDCTKQKNPSYSVCAQKVLHIMQETKAKLSVVLLDMCRVVAPQDPITDLSGVYQQPYPAKSYPGYHIYGFSCSPAEKAFEVACGGGSGEEDGELRSVGEGNSIFVAALKEHLQFNGGSISDTVQDLFSATAQGVYRHKPPGVNGQWQRPEISTNVAESLSLTDKVDPTLLPDHVERRSRRWKDAHSVPEPVILGSIDGHLALRFHFEAEHTNVLLIQVEVLQGCLMETEVERMNVELILQDKPVQLILGGFAPQTDYGSCSIPIQKSLAKKNLLHFKVPDLQKIMTPEVTLHISTNYRWRDSQKEGSMWQFRMEQIYHRMSPPPLYGKITAHEDDQQQQQQQTRPPPIQPLPHFQDHRMFHPGSNPTPFHPLSMQQ